MEIKLCLFKGEDKKSGFITDSMGSSSANAFYKGSVTILIPKNLGSGKVLKV